MTHEPPDVGPSGQRLPDANSGARRRPASWWIPTLIVIVVLVVGWVWGWGTWFGTHPTNGTGGRAIVTSSPMGNATAQKGTTGMAPPNGPPPAAAPSAPGNTAPPPNPLPDSSNNKP